MPADYEQILTPLLLRPLGQPPAKAADFGALLARREELFGILKRLSGSNRQTELKPHLGTGRRAAYTLDPHTRYASWSKAADEPAGVPKLAQPPAPKVGGGPRMAFHGSPRRPPPPMVDLTK